MDIGIVTSFYNGYDERFIGWGSEDACFIRAAVTMIDKPFLRLNAEVYHLWHPVDRKRHQKRNKNSGKLIESYKKAFKDTEKMRAVLEGKP